MLVVVGDVTVREGALDEALAISREHVVRSRSEPGCLSHDVLTDPDRPDRLVFVERWLDRAALDVHFEVPESLAFARRLAKLAVGAADMKILPIEPRD